MISRSKRFCGSSSLSNTKRAATGHNGSCSSPIPWCRTRESHGDIIVWPLKALCDYVEATGDFAFLDETIAWRREDNFEKTAHADPVSAHVDKLIETVRARFIPGTNLIRYGNGDWNDSLQPVDPTKRDWMTSAWTVVLLYEQLRRYAEILRQAKRGPRRAKELDALAAAMRKDFNAYLIRDGVVAGYGVFRPEGGEPELLLHPSDKQTGLSFSLLPMTQGMIGGLFTQAQARRHLSLIRKHLLFSDGARLMDRPIAYHGGPETFFQRAESAAFFGREIGLMYTHSHLRYGEAMSDIGEFAALWEALMVANPIAVTDELTECVAEAAQRLFQQQRRGLPGPLSGERRMGARQSKLDRGRWRLARLFERPGALHQHAHSPRLWASTPIRQENCDAGLEKVAQRPHPRMARTAWRRLAAAVRKAA